ncbi:hypothetical protein CH333_07245, partial [candidate division WOR-3 bacterium JGI_Cruoil_03_44_89]
MKKRVEWVILLTLLFSSLCFSEGARYLIITPDSFYEAILPLAEWKTKKGMKTKVAKLSQTGSSASQIRSYIIEAYNYWDPRPEYLLLVGDYNTINMPYHGGTESDNYYTDIEDDLYNEIIPGRFPASNVSQVNTMVSKTLGYERTPYLDDMLWFRRGTVIVREDWDEDDSIYWDDSYFAIDNMLGCRYVVVDTFSWSGGDDEQDVENAITNGRTFVQFRGSTQYDWNYPFDVDPYSTNNGFKLPVVLSATCNTVIGYWPTIGEKFMRAGTATSPKGAVGFAGVTTSGMNWAHIRSAIARGFVNSMFRGSSILGEACEQGRKNVYILYNSSMHYNSFICLGDPELNLWTSTPDTLSVSHPEFINLAVSGVTVNVLNNDGLTPVYNALVCLMMDTTVYKYGYTNEDGNATLAIDPQNLGNMYVTVTSRNYLPYEGVISVLPAGPILTYHSFSITDTLNGNGDGIMNPGEAILLDVSLENMGNGVAESVYATISADTESVTVLDSIGYFGDILPDSSRWDEDGFSFFVSPDCPPGYTFAFLLDVFDKGGNTWQVSMPYFYVETGKLTVDTAVVYDTLPGGNANSRLDPGETVLLDVSVKNAGPSALYGADGILKCHSDFVLMKDSILVYSQILPDSTANSSSHIEFIVSPLTVPGYDIPFELYTVEDGSTYTHCDTISFSLEVGEVGTNIPTGPDEYGYYCYDNTDTLYGFAPTYDWFEIAPPG